MMARNLLAHFLAFKCHSSLLARRPFGGPGRLKRLAEARIFLNDKNSAIINRQAFYDFQKTLVLF